MAAMMRDCIIQNIIIIISDYETKSEIFDLKATVHQQIYVNRDVSLISTCEWL